jgi:ribosomal protein S18 acetylase RimI-like enzyme
MELLPMHYFDTAAHIESGQLVGFFEGWPNPPSQDAHLQILQKSAHVVLATEPNGQVVGFATAISDGVLSAYISLLEVLPPYRRQGVGTQLVRRLLQQLSGLYSVNLHCDAELLPFYETLGMRALGGMAIRDYSAQSGRHAA